MRWNFIEGKTLEEANQLVKNLGYFVEKEDELLNYQNVIKVRIENGLITKIVGIGTWRANES